MPTFRAFPPIGRRPEPFLFSDPSKPAPAPKSRGFRLPGARSRLRGHKEHRKSTRPRAFSLPPVPTYTRTVPEAPRPVYRSSNAPIRTRHPPTICATAPGMLKLSTFEVPAPIIQTPTPTQMIRLIFVNSKPKVHRRSLSGLWSGCRPVVPRPLSKLSSSGRLHPDRRR